MNTPNDGVAKTSADHEATVAKSRLSAVLAITGPSPVKDQVAFLRQLLEDPDAMRTFLEHPEVIAARSGVVVDPDVMRGMADTIVFGEPVSENILRELGPERTEQLLSLRGPGTVAAFPIAAAAAVAVASAAVALIAQASTTMSLAQLKGLRAPVAAQFVASATSAIVVAYAVTTATAALVAKAASTSLPAGLSAFNVARTRT